MSEEKSNISVFANLSSKDVSSKIKTKPGKRELSFLPWASAWEEVKKAYPTAQYTIYEKIIDEYGNTRFWHDDGSTGWVKVGVSIDGLEHVVQLPIMNAKNESIQADQITSFDANKSLQRCLTKACGMHGLGLYIYQGEDLPEDVTKAIELKSSIKELVEKKCELSENAKARVSKLCRDAEKQANPDVQDDLITGDYRRIEDVDILTSLKKNLLAVRK